MFSFLSIKEVVCKLSYFKKILTDTIDSINKLYENNVTEVTVRKIRACKNISSTEKSKIVFISKILTELSKKGFLKYIGKNSPKKYKIEKEIDPRQAFKAFGVD
ncbi:MAG: hypothetical protein ACTSRZ_00640 [Promethearchaeota archaeon]